MSIFCDWKSNKKNLKGKIVLILFRISHLSLRSKVLFFIMIPYLILYRIFIEWILGIELPYKTKVGKGLILYHGQGLVINDNCILGEDCVVRHSTTIGNKQLLDGSYSKSPIIGNNVDIGSQVCIIGPVIIGNNVKIGAGSVVVKDVQSNCIVVGNPAKVIRYLT